MKAKSGAERQAAFRDKGRQIAVVLRDPKALKALERLEKRHSGVRAAVEAALIHATSRATDPPH